MKLNRFAAGIAVVLVAAWPSLALAQGLVWESLGPSSVPGPVRHLIADPIAEHRLYAGTEHGGLWVHDDARNADLGWQPLSERLDSLQIRGLAKSRVNRQHVVVGTATGFIHESRDHGQSWSRIGAHNHGYIRRLFLSERLRTVFSPPPGPPTLQFDVALFVAGRQGLVRIERSGDSWLALRTLYPEPFTPAQQADVLDALTSDTHAEQFVAVRGQGVWRSLSSLHGARLNWELVARSSDFQPTDGPMIKLARSSDGARVYAKLGRRVIMSDRRGEAGSWVAQVTPPFMDGQSKEVGGRDFGYRGNYSGEVGEWTHAIAVSPQSAQHLAAGQAALFFSAVGGGGTAGGDWQPLDAGHEDVQSLLFSRDGSVLFVGHDGGVSRLCKAAGSVASYVACAPSVLDGWATSQFYRAALNGRALVGNVDHQGIWGTSDIQARPVRWRRASRQSSGFGNNALENDFVSADPDVAGRFYVQFNNEHLLRLRFPPEVDADLLPLNAPNTPLRPFTLITGDSVANIYNQLNYGLGTVAIDRRPSSESLLVSVHVDTNKKFGVALTRHRRSEPRGGPKIDCPDGSPTAGGCFSAPITGTAAFNLVLGPVQSPIVSVAFSSDPVGRAFALDQSGAVFELTGLDSAAPTAGVATRVFDLPDAAMARQIVEDPAAAGHLIALSDSALARSDDGHGRQWQPVNPDRLPPGRLQSLAFHPRNSSILFLGTDRGLWLSLDGGASWTDASDKLPRVHVMQVLADDKYVYAVTFGRGLWAARLTP